VAINKAAGVAVDKWMFDTTKLASSDYIAPWRVVDVILYTELSTVGRDIVAICGRPTSVFT